MTVINVTKSDRKVVDLSKKAAILANERSEGRYEHEKVLQVFHLRLSGHGRNNGYCFLLTKKA